MAVTESRRVSRREQSPLSKTIICGKSANCSEDVEPPCTVLTSALAIAVQSLPVPRPEFSDSPTLQEVRHMESPHKSEWKMSQCSGLTPPAGKWE